MTFHPACKLLSVLMLVTVVQGCASQPPPAVPATRPGGQHVAAVLATCYPPDGWKPEPLKSSGRHTHQIWISPSGQTAYGVAHFTLPLPVGADLVLWSFLHEMKRTEGVANLIEKHDAPDLPGLRFEAVGGLYHVRANLTVKGWEGWVTYAATSAGRSAVPAELKASEDARDWTMLDQHP